MLLHQPLVLHLLHLIGIFQLPQFCVLGELQSAGTGAIPIRWKVAVNALLHLQPHRFRCVGISEKLALYRAKFACHLLHGGLQLLPQLLHLRECIAHGTAATNRHLLKEGDWKTKPARSLGLLLVLLLTVLSVLRAEALRGLHTAVLVSKGRIHLLGCVRAPFDLGVGVANHGNLNRWHWVRWKDLPFHSHVLLHRNHLRTALARSTLRYFGYAALGCYACENIRD
mmetsp:Transcript_34155/g.79725  ORF Transcript_34155/g.79725 Transcript_34155/m.79725 type:complete len:226 (+) Transcript_34155:2278-2955(+)